MCDLRGPFSKTTRAHKSILSGSGLALAAMLDTMAVPPSLCGCGNGITGHIGWFAEDTIRGEHGQPKLVYLTYSNGADMDQGKPRS